jgi:hypothetical protein
VDLTQLSQKSCKRQLSIAGLVDDMKGPEKHESLFPFLISLSAFVFFWGLSFSARAKRSLKAREATLLTL